MAQHIVSPHIINDNTSTMHRLTCRPTGIMIHTLRPTNTLKWRNENRPI